MSASSLLSTEASTQVNPSIQIRIGSGSNKLHSVPSLKSDLIKILDQLSEADKGKRLALEEKLLHMGAPVIPLLIAQLSHDCRTQRSFLCMALIRFGAAAVPAIERFNNGLGKLPEYRWISHFLSHHLSIANAS